MVLQNFVSTLLVGLLITLFEYWLNNQNKK
ncbi:type I toxin-antitoxin system Fst family toxin [Enterococcus faecalis]|nr:type I toxin-antitoxin system Fst family toxin [Enterococcus faecalis]